MENPLDNPFAGQYLGQLFFGIPSYYPSSYKQAIKNGYFAYEFLNRNLPNNLPPQLVSNVASLVALSTVCDPFKIVSYAGTALSTLGSMFKTKSTVPASSELQFPDIPIKDEAIPVFDFEKHIQAELDLVVFLLENVESGLANSGYLKDSEFQKKVCDPNESNLNNDFLMLVPYMEVSEDDYLGLTKEEYEYVKTQIESGPLALGLRNSIESSDAYIRARNRFITT
tara:strand:- start:29 stop:706 length:678 start_codon:yes stop_codon:yes gene_type:complete